MAEPADALDAPLEHLTGADMLRINAFVFVKRKLGIGLTDLVSRRRQQPLVHARALFVWIVRSHNPAAPISYPTIAAWLGGRHHTTVMHLYLDRAPELQRRDARFRMLCEAFEHEFPSLKETPDGDTRH